MKIVIDIPNFAWIEDIKDFKSAVKEYDKGSAFDHAIREALLLGTPLPEHHGDLIDRSKICKAIPAEEDNCTGFGMTYDEMDIYNDGINSMWNKLQNADPIIEADKESEE